MEEKNTESNTETTSKNFSIKMKETSQRGINYLRNNKYQTFLYIFLGLVILAIIVSF